MEDSEHKLIALAAVLVLGTASQWLAWRLRLPSILLLLACGVTAGPITGWIRPDALLGDLLFPIVSLSVAVVLFEGSLQLRLRELQDIGVVLLKLLTVGMVVTWALTTVAACYVLGFSLFKSLLLGAVLVVTGPTVIGPLLRHIRPVGRVGPISRWEGIVIDPVGAVLAVLVYEVNIAMTATGVEQASWLAVAALAKTTILGGGIGVAAAILAGQALRRNLIPDHLQSGVVLMLVLIAFVTSNALQSESGLVAVTVMGVVLANLPGVVLHPVLEFKENLSVLLIASLFILLSARLDPIAFGELGWRGPAFVVIMILFVRPLSIFVATLGTRLDWRERVFLGWLAPRGIVAASVASVFALRLGVDPVAEDVTAEVVEGVVQNVASEDPVTGPRPASVLTAPGSGLAPATFLVIFGTVVVYGLTTPILARRLGLASHNPQGVLLGGAGLVARRIAQALQEAGYPVLLVDINRWNIQAARMEGLRTAHENILSEHALEDLDLGGIGRFFGVTPNDEVNALAALQLAPLFGRANVFQLAPHSQAEGTSQAGHLRARYLGNAQLTFRELEDQLEHGAKIKLTKLTEAFTFQDFQKRYGDTASVLFVSDGSKLTVVSQENPILPKPGHTVISLVNDTSRDEGSSDLLPTADASSLPS